MALPNGTRLGPYEIRDFIGAGGMGEVYRGADKRLDRVVAIKILPVHLADSERRQRFEREARTISSLNHRHICALYDVGRQDKLDFLVMEYLEGETLGTRLAHGPLPRESFFLYASQIAQALTHAHRRGVLHRDLKPGNVMITREGVKLLDFGLAKVLQRPRVLDATATMEPARAHDATREGAILGTLQYMAPEQLEGKDVDERADIFSFGAVLYEMAAGQKAFTGQSPASVIASILKTDPPPLTGGGRQMPAALDRVIRKCLDKDPDSRWQTAQDLSTNLEWAAENASGPSGSPAAQSPRRERIAWISAAVLLVTSVLLFSYSAFRRGAPPPLRVTRFSIPPPEKTTLSAAAPAVSPDGSLVAFLVATEGRSMVWVRPIDSLVARPLSGTDEAAAMFWSPDNRFLAFIAGNKLKKIELSNGSVSTVCDTQSNAPGDWNHDGLIVFSSSRTGPLHRVQAAGGVPAPLTTLDSSRGDYNHSWPQWLPGGRHILYFVRTGLRETTGIYAAALHSATTTSKLIMESHAAGRYQPPRGSGTGHLLFLDGDTLMARSFNPSNLEIGGEPIRIAEQVGGLTVESAGNPGFSTSDNGVLAYHNITGARAQLVWHDRAGRAAETMAASDVYSHAKLSPDGARVAFERPDPKTTRNDLWIADTKRAVTSRLTYTPEGEGTPLWSPDGERIVYSSMREGSRNLYWKAAAGGSEEVLLKSEKSKVPSDWSRDGKFILFYQGTESDNSWDLWAMPVSGDRKPFPVVESPFRETHGQFSPDRRWVVYASNETGTQEIYARPFHAENPAAQSTGKSIQITSGGGSHPRWRGDGRELFYRAPGDRMMVLPVTLGTKFQTGTPQFLFQVRGARTFEDILYDYDVHPDGRRFLFNISIEGSVSPITVVVNWDARL